MSHVSTAAHNILSDLRLAKRETDLMEIMKKFTSQCGFSAFQLAPGPHNPTLDPTTLLAIGTYHHDWKRQYGTEPSCRHDPARAQAILRAGSIYWRRVFAHVRELDQRAFVAGARAQGFKDGVTTPIHGPQGCVAIMMFAADHKLEFDGEDEEALSHVAMALHQRVRRLTAAALVNQPETAKLTPREVECLQWVLEGKTNWEIGVLTGVTARTVQFHLSNCARKLGSYNRVQAAVAALIRGDLTVPIKKSNESVTTQTPVCPITPVNRNYSCPSKYSASFSEPQKAQDWRG